MADKCAHPACSCTGPEGRSVGQILQRVPQETGRPPRTSLRVPSPRMQVTSLHDVADSCLLQIFAAGVSGSMVISLERRASTRRMLAVCAALVLATIPAACGTRRDAAGRRAGRKSRSAGRRPRSLSKTGPDAGGLECSHHDRRRRRRSSSSPFSRRWKKAERRTIPFQMFRTEDGSLFSAADSTPKEVRLEGKDTLNNDYLVTLPWERGR